MSPDDNFNTPDCRVDFDRETAWVVTFEDRKGRLGFVFELGGNSGEIVLCRRPLENGKVVDLTNPSVRERAYLALKHVQSFFEARGETVEIYEN